MYVRGEDVNIGLGVETTRGTPVTPAIWLPGRSPAGMIAQVDKVDIQETRATKMASQGAEIVGLSASGSIEFNLRNKSLGYILKSLMGSTAPALVAGETTIYRHTFDILLSNPQHPALTVGMSVPGIQDYEYALSIIKALNISISADDLPNGSIDIESKSEAEHASYSPAFVSDDYYFRHQDLTFKIATDVASLAGSTALKPKKIDLSIDNGARGNRNASELQRSDVLVSGFNIGGSFDMDFQAKTYHDIFTAGTYRAVSIVLNRLDVTLGTGAHPRLEIILPKVSFNSYDQDRPIDDILTESIGMTAHYSLSDGYGIRINLDNAKPNYTS
jgi:hypothetical protein